MRMDAIDGSASRCVEYLHAMVMPESGVGLDPHCSFSVTVPPVVGCQVIVETLPAAKVLLFQLMGFGPAATRAAKRPRTRQKKRMVSVEVKRCMTARTAGDTAGDTEGC